MRRERREERREKREKKPLLGNHKKWCQKQQKFDLFVVIALNVLVPTKKRLFIIRIIILLNHIYKHLESFF